MKISYGSTFEKYLLVAGFLFAAAAAAGVLVQYDLFRMPYLHLPMLLGLSSLLMACFPLRPVQRSRLWNGLYRTLPVLLIMAAVSVGSSFTFASEDTESVSDTLIHGVEFFAVGLLMARGVAPVSSDRRLRSVLAALAGVLAFGMLDEFHQSFVPGRDPSLRDLCTDMAGGIAGALFYTFLFSRLLTHKRIPDNKPSPN